MAEGEEKKKNGLDPTKIALGFAAFFIIFALFAGLSGCLQNQSLGDTFAGVFNEGAKAASQNQCSLGFLSFGLSVAGWWLGLAGSLFDYSLLAFVVSVGSLLGKNSPLANGIVIAWEVLRDLGNLVFIGLLIYTAVSMILQLQSAKVGQTIVKIIVAALLVNFSFFFAGVIIDASNFLSKTIYKEAIYGGGEFINPLQGLGSIQSANDLVQSGAGQVAQRSAETAPISSRFMAITKLGSLYDLSSGDLQVGGRFEKNSAFPYLLAGFGIVVLSATAGVFMAAALFLIIRFVIIIILLITSPIAVLSFTGISMLQAWGKAWWNTLFAQTIFPVVFLILIGTTFKVMEVGLQQNISGDATFFKLILNTSNPEAWFANINLVFVYIIALLLTHLSLQIAMGVATQQAFQPPSAAKLFQGAAAMQKAFQQTNPRLVATNVISQTLRETPSTLSRGLFLDKLPNLPSPAKAFQKAFGNPEEKLSIERENRAKKLVREILKKPIAEQTKEDRDIWKSLPEEAKKEANKEATPEERKRIAALDVGGGQTQKPQEKKPAPKDGGDQTKKSASGGSDNTTRASASASFTAIDQRLASFEQSLREGNQSLARSMEDLTDIERRDLFQEAMLQRTEIFADRDNTRKIAEAIGGDRFNKTVAEFPANKFSAQIADAIAPHLDEIGYSLLRTRKDFTPDQHKMLDDSMARNNSGVMASVRAIRPDIR